MTDLTQIEQSIAEWKEKREAADRTWDRMSVLASHARNSPLPEQASELLEEVKRLREAIQKFQETHDNAHKTYTNREAAVRTSEMHDRAYDDLLTMEIPE